MLELGRNTDYESLRAIQVRFDPMTGRHHHLVCETCGSLDDLGDSAVPRVPLPDPSGTGFHIRDYSVSFSGLCAKCQ